MRTPSLIVFLSVAVSCAAPAGGVRADDCVAKPNAPAAPGQYWYYQTDRNVEPHCWHLASQGLSVQNSATEALKQTTPERPETPAASSGAPQPATAGSTGKPAAAAADEPPSLRSAPQPPFAKPRRSAVAIAAAQELPANTRPSGAAAATLVVQGNHTFALIMLATVLLAIAGPVIHAARWRRQRNGGDRHALAAPSPSIVSTSDSHAPIFRDLNAKTAVRHTSSRNETEDVTQTLQRLIDDMETRRRPDKTAV